MVFQGYNLIPALTVGENVALPLTYQHVPQKERMDRARIALEQVVIANKIGSRPTQLSGGQQQRVAIARAIATKSPVIMADEPTGALDSKTGAQILEILKQQNREGTTIILITHELSIAANASRVITMIDDKLVKDCTGAQLIKTSAGDI